MADSTQSIQATLRALPSLAGPFPPSDLDHLPDTPHDAFRIWLSHAISENVKEPHAMTLSTVDTEGQPDARVLILKDLDDRGWHFAISADSAKGQQMAASPKVALSFYWPQLGRQVRLRGSAVALSEAESAQSFTGRSTSARATAAASRQSQVLGSTDELRGSLEEARKLVRENPDFVMPAWRACVVQPDTVEFWQGASDRMHERLQYLRGADDDTWEKRRLWP